MLITEGRKSHRSSGQSLSPAPANSQYGTLQWCEHEYGKVQEDPWGLTWRPSQLLRYHRVLSTLDALKEPIAHAMDVGCATGDFTYLLSRHARGLQRVVGVDFVDSAIERARRRFPNLTFSKESIFALGDRYPERFDLITCLEVIYYVPKDQQVAALRSVRRALRPGGYTVFSSLISPPPHFFPEELLDLVRREFEIVRSEILYLRLISFMEKIGTRSEKLIPFRLGPHRLGRLPFRAVIAIEKWSRNLGSHAASHTILLARTRP